MKSRPLRFNLSIPATCQSIFLALSNELIHLIIPYVLLLLLEQLLPNIMFVPGIGPLVLVGVLTGARQETFFFDGHVYESFLSWREIPLFVAKLIPLMC